MENILIVNAGTGNLRSVANTLTKLGFEAKISASVEDVSAADRIILPGVGAFGEFMAGLTHNKLISALKTFLDTGRPLLGICVGMQALFELSEEMGQHPGLNLLDGKVLRFPDSIQLKIPHTGWNQLDFNGDAPLFKNISRDVYVYFNHTYFCQPANPENIAATTHYGFDFCSAVQAGNLYGVQFHPEKSQLVGKQILHNFLTMPAYRKEV
jgi:glutamine amidotransferase